MPLPAPPTALRFHWRPMSLIADLPARWRRLGAAGWPAGLALLGVVALLLAFHQVVSGAVAQAGRRHADAAARALAAGHCQRQGSRRQHDACVTALADAAAADTSAPAGAAGAVR